VNARSPALPASNPVENRGHFSEPGERLANALTFGIQ
jgi:hypothetical protein